MARTAGRPQRSKMDILEFRSKIGKQAIEIYRAEGFEGVSIRRLAKEVNCAPMTIYAHFEGKTDILRYLWADILSEMSDEIRKNLKPISAPEERLRVATHTFLCYWIDHPDHFRLVFMSTDVTRADVDVFVADEKTLEHFSLFAGLIENILPNDVDLKLRTDTLISGMIGIALCMITIADYPWSSATSMVERIVSSIIS